MEITHQKLATMATDILLLVEKHQSEGDGNTIIKIKEYLTDKLCNDKLLIEKLEYGQRLIAKKDAERFDFKEGCTYKVVSNQDGWVAIANEKDKLCHIQDEQTLNLYFKAN